MTKRPPPARRAVDEEDGGGRGVAECLHAEVDAAYLNDVIAWRVQYGGWDSNPHALSGSGF
jgi:hypothetical protein